MPLWIAWLKELLPFLSVVVSLLAVVIGPYVTLRVAKRQIRANTISSFRHTWINALREELANFIGKAHATFSSSAYTLGTPIERLRAHEDLWRVAAKIEMFVNPDDPEHQELIKRMKAIVGSTSKADKNLTADQKALNVEQFANRNLELIAQGQKVIKIEWDRVKKHE